MRRLRLSYRDPWQRVARTSVMLLLLMIAISPVTQTIWKGDDFLHGHDTETTLVLGLTLASMSLLRMQRSRIDMDETLKRVRDFLSSIFGAWLLWYLTELSHYSSEPVAIPHSRGRPGKHTGYPLPLLI
jgi:hypothetical protein